MKPVGVVSVLLLALGALAQNPENTTDFNNFNVSTEAGSIINKTSISLGTTPNTTNFIGASDSSNNGTETIESTTTSNNQTGSFNRSEITSTSPNSSTPPSTAVDSLKIATTSVSITDADNFNVSKVLSTTQEPNSSATTQTELTTIRTPNVTSVGTDVNTTVASNLSVTTQASNSSTDKLSSLDILQTTRVPSSSGIIHTGLNTTAVPLSVDFVSTILTSLPSTIHSKFTEPTIPSTTVITSTTDGSNFTKSDNSTTLGIVLTATTTSNGSANSEVTIPSNLNISDVLSATQEPSSSGTIQTELSTIRTPNDTSVGTVVNSTDTTEPNSTTRTETTTPSTTVMVSTTNESNFTNPGTTDNSTILDIVLTTPTSNMSANNETKIPSTTGNLNISDVLSTTQEPNSNDTAQAELSTTGTPNVTLVGTNVTTTDERFSNTTQPNVTTRTETTTPSTTVTVSTTDESNFTNPDNSTILGIVLTTTTSSGSANIEVNYSTTVTQEPSSSGTRQTELSTISIPNVTPIGTDANTTDERFPNTTQPNPTTRTETAIPIIMSTMNGSNFTNSDDSTTPGTISTTPASSGTVNVEVKIPNDFNISDYLSTTQEPNSNGTTQTELSTIRTPNVTSIGTDVNTTDERFPNTTQPNPTQTPIGDVSNNISTTVGPDNKTLSLAWTTPQSDDGTHTEVSTLSTTDDFNISDILLTTEVYSGNANTVLQPRFIFILIFIHYCFYCY